MKPQRAQRGGNKIIKMRVGNDLYGLLKKYVVTPTRRTCLKYG
jgi:hypothetical protein